MRRRTGIWPVINTRSLLLMGVLALGHVRTGACASEAKAPPLPQLDPSPQIELLAREVDGVDLLRAVATFAPYDFMAVREGDHSRFDIPTHTARLEELWADIVARAGMQHVARNGVEIVVNACRLPLQTEPSDSLIGDEPVTMHFNRISTIHFFALVARLKGLK